MDPKYHFSRKGNSSLEKWLMSELGLGKHKKSTRHLRCAKQQGNAQRKRNVCQKKKNQSEGWPGDQNGTYLSNKI